MASVEIRGYRELVIWKRSMELVLMVYKLIRRLPKEENYALSDQIRRAVVSIPSNIAEGNGRASAKEYIRFLCIARGSKNEIETQLLICVQLHYLTENEIQPALNLCDEIGRMLNALIARLDKQGNRVGQ